MRTSNVALQHISTILCDYLIRSESGRMSTCGIFRNIHAPALPVTKGPLGIYVELMGQEGDPFKVSIEGLGIDFVVSEGILDPPEKLIQFQQRSVNIAGEMGLQFDSFGIFYVVVRSGDEVIHSTPYGVIQQIASSETRENDED